MAISTNAVAFFGGYSSDLANVGFIVHRDVLGIRERDDLNRNAPLFREFEKPRQGRASGFGRELEKMLRHQQHADDVQLLGTRPVEIGDSFRLASRGNHFRETKCGDAAPEKRPPGRVGEAGSRRRAVEMPAWP